MADKEVTGQCGANKLPTKPTYEKRPGTSGAEGHFMEINLLTLCKLRGDRQLKDFYLAGNLESAGDFDDVVFRYVDDSVSDRQNVIFLQSKFKQNANHKITIATFETDHDWPLQKYFQSYTNIMDEFNKSGLNDPIFGGKKDDLNCHFVIYTNANRHDDMKEYVIEAENPFQFVLGEETHGQAFKLKVDKVKQFLQGVQHDLEIEQVMKLLKQMHTAKCKNLNRDENFKTYHAFFTQTVFVKRGIYWVYRNDFLEGNFQNEVLKKFRDRTFGWYNEQMGVAKNANNDGDTLNHMKGLQLDLPPWFQNATPKFNDKLCDEFIAVASEGISDNICTITKMGKKLVKEVSKFVGNVLVFDEDKAMFKFNAEQLDDEPRKILEYLTKQHNLDPQLYFAVQVENFPIPSLGFTQIDSKKVGKFADTLSILTGQPNGDCLKQIIERDFGNPNDKEFGRHQLIMGKMTYWWKQPGQIDYLRKHDGFIEGILNGILFNLSDTIQSFIGRTEELAKLHDVLQNNGSGERTAVISQMASVSGLGGVGKSELARQYAHAYGHSYDGNIIWIDAETRYSMQNCFRKLCKDYLNIQIQDANQKEIEMATIVQKVYSFFGDRKCLFIFDNAQYFKNNSALNDNINDFLPNKQQGITKPHFLITSRNQQWGCTKKIELGVLQDAEAEQLIKVSLEIKDDEQDDVVKELMKLLHNFPLALQQAITCIRQKGEEYEKIRGTQFKISDYLDLYKDKTKQLLDFQFPDDCADKYTKTTFTTWSITLAEIENSELGNDAKVVFSIMAYLNPNDIPLKFFTQILANDLEKLSQVFMLIEKYSMITLRNGMANIHRLVQSVTRLMLQDAGQQNLVLQLALYLLSVHTDNYLITQGASVWNYANKDDDLIIAFKAIPGQIIKAFRETWRCEEAYAFGKVSLETLKLKIGHDHEETLNAQFQLARTLFEQGLYNDALSCSEELLVKNTKFLGPNHHATLATQENIAQTLAKQGQYDDALMFYKEILEKETKSLGPDHLSTFTTKHNIAQILSKQGQYEEALSSFKEILVKKTKLLGPNHQSTLSTQNDMANTLCQQDQYEQALNSYKELLVTETKFLGPNHLVTLRTEKAIAEVLALKGQYDEALSCYKEVLEKMISVLGPNHPDTLSTANDIANTLQMRGQYTDALSSYTEILEKGAKVLGPTHPNTLRTKDDLADILNAKGQYEEALHSYKEVHQNRTKALGPDHPATLQTRYNIAQTLFANGQYTDALNSFKETFEKSTKILGPDHPDTLAAQHDIAHTLFKQCKYEDALSSYKEVLEKETKILGPDNKNTLTTQYYIAQTLSKQGHYADALKSYKEVLEKQANALGPDHSNTLATRYNIAQTLSQQGQYHEAIRYYNEIVERETKISVPDRPDTSAPQHDIADRTSHQDQYDEAFTCYTDVLEDRIKVLGPNHPYTLTTENDIAGILSKQGQYEEALGSYKAVLEKRTKALGPNHPDTLTTENDIAGILSKQGQYEEALGSYKVVLEKKTKALGPNHLDTLTTEKDIADTLNLQGLYEAALGTYRKVAEIMTKVLGPNHPNTLDTEIDIANTLNLQGLHKDALSTYINVLQIRIKVLGPNHPDTLATEMHIADILSQHGIK